MEDLKNIVESLLFVAEEPLSVEKLRALLAPVTGELLHAVLEDLIRDYEERDGGFVLRQVAGGYQFRTRSQYNQWIKRMLKASAPRLSRAALETLAIIAYKQPIIRADIEQVRGVDSGGVLRMLLDRKLIRILGRKDIAGRPLIYATTKKFLETFELRDLKDLPTPAELESLSDEGPIEQRRLPFPKDPPQTADTVFLPPETEPDLPMEGEWHAEETGENT